MDRRFSPRRVEKTIQQFKRNRQENRWDGGRHLTKKVCVQLLMAISGEKGEENHADYRHLCCADDIFSGMSLHKQA